MSLKDILRPPARSRQRLYVVYDRVAEEAGPIQSCINDGVALRMFRATLQDVSSELQSEYWLFCVGEYDPQKMTVEGCAPLRIEIPPSQLDLLKKDES